MRKIFVLGLLLVALTLTGCGGGSSKPDDAAIVGNLASQFLNTFLQANVSSVQSYFANSVDWTVFVDQYGYRTFPFTPDECQTAYLSYKDGVDDDRRDHGLELFLNWEPVVSLSGGAATVTGVATLTATWSWPTTGGNSIDSVVRMSLTRQGASWLIRAIDWGDLLIFYQLTNNSATVRPNVTTQ